MDTLDTQSHLTSLQVNNRRLTPGESCILRDGDSVRFGLCVLSHFKTHQPLSGYVQGKAFSYTFHSFVARSPPGLSASDESLRTQFKNVERAKAAIIEERARLGQELSRLEENGDRMYVPP